MQTLHRTEKTKEQYSELVRMTEDELCARVKPWLDTKELLEKTKKRESSLKPQAAKVVYAWRDVWEKASSNMLTSKNFKEYFVKKTGSETTSRLQTLAAVFGAYVRKHELITEEEYDCCHASWLEKAYRILSLAGDNFGRDNIYAQETAKILTRRDASCSTNSVKQELDAIIIEMGGGKVDAETGKVITPEEIVDLANGMIEKGEGAKILTLFTRNLGFVGKWSQDQRDDITSSLRDFMGHWETRKGSVALNDDPVKIITAPTVEPSPPESEKVREPNFGAHAKKLAPKTTGDKLVKLTKAIRYYFSELKQLPDNRSELSAFIKAQKQAA